jgi:hypothetical protein
MIEVGGIGGDFGAGDAGEAEHVVKGPVLHHQDDDVFDRVMGGRGSLCESGRG